MNITVRLQGGLGNQLFQYAAGYAILRKKNTQSKILIDSSYFENINKIDLLSIIEKSHYAIGVPIKRGLLERLINRTALLEKFYAKRYLIEKKLTFDNSFKDTKNIKGIIGYWQSEKYFIECANELKKIYRVGLQIREPKIVGLCSLHIRGGDYLKGGVHVNIGLDYYLQAVEYVRSKGVNEFKIFTDDIKYAEKIIRKLNINYTMPKSKLNSTIETLAEMSECTHNIIANSSFSWWASYLNINNSKIVVAPKLWYVNSETDLNKSSQISEII